MAAEQDKRQATEWRCEKKNSCTPVFVSFVYHLHFMFLILLFLPGAELLVERLGPGVGGQEKENPNIFLVGASWQRLLTGAEEAGFFKEYNDGSMRGFTCGNKHNFTGFKGKVRRNCSLLNIYAV